MIPKTIHYCWFGRNPLPSSARKCIASWKKYLPDYEIKEWNEDNFDVNRIPYTRDAYAAKKYAFVSDYARFWVLYHYGGVYFDTDVEVIRPMNDIIAKGPFMGWEKPGSTGVYSIAPGLGLAANKEQPLYQEILDGFEDLTFYNEKGEINKYTMIPFITDLLTQKGLKKDGSLQVINDVILYPSEFLCPLEYFTGKVTITDNTYAIHWYTMTWLPQTTVWRFKLMRLIRRFLR